MIRNRQPQGMYQVPFFSGRDTERIPVFFFVFPGFQGTSSKSGRDPFGRHCYCETFFGFENVYHFKETKKCCAVVLSQLVSSRYINNTLLTLFEAGIPVILIHGNSSRPIVKEAAIAISFENRESITKAGGFSSRIVKTYILNVLYAVVFSLHYDENVRSVREYGKAAEARLDRTV